MDASCPKMLLTLTHNGARTWPRCTRVLPALTVHIARRAKSVISSTSSCVLVGIDVFRLTGSSDGCAAWASASHVDGPLFSVHLLVMRSSSGFPSLMCAPRFNTRSSLAASLRTAPFEGTAVTDRPILTPLTRRPIIRAIGARHPPRFVLSFEHSTNFTKPVRARAWPRPACLLFGNIRARSRNHLWSFPVVQSPSARRA